MGVARLEGGFVKGAAAAPAEQLPVAPAGPAGDALAKGLAAARAGQALAKLPTGSP